MKTTWDDAQRICDLPEVDEAIRALLDDHTGDNATCLVRAVIEADRASICTSQDTASTPGRRMTDALRAVISERERQVFTEGWNAQHDDEHTDGSLAQAAACYATRMKQRRKLDTVDMAIRGEGPVWGSKHFKVPALWPDSWHASWWKPKDRRRDLVRAAALLLAEIERLDRAIGAQPRAQAHCHAGPKPMGQAARIERLEVAVRLAIEYGEFPVGAGVLRELQQALAAGLRGVSPAADPQRNEQEK